MRVSILFLLLSLGTWAAPAVLGQSDMMRPFPDVVLAAEADWFRPDLAARRVRSVTRTFAGSAQWQPLGDSRNLVTEHPSTLSHYQLREVLRYDSLGRLLHYQLTAIRDNSPPEQLLNEFRYDAQQRLVTVKVSGTPALTQLTDGLTLDMYCVQLAARNPTIRYWRPSFPLTQGHLLPRQFFTSLETLTLQQLRFEYNAAGQRRLAQATLKLQARRRQPKDSTWTWQDTVRLDLHRGLRMTVVGSRWGAVDTSWLRPSARWLQPLIRAPNPPDTTQTLRLHQFVDYYHDDFPSGDDSFALTSFFDAAGRLRLTRQPEFGQVGRYDYDTLGQIRQLTMYQVELPFQRPPLPYFGFPDDPHYMIVDCAGQLRQWLPLPGGLRALLVLARTQQMRYEGGADGLPGRATVLTTTAHFKPDVQFRFLQTATWRGGHFVNVSDWRHLSAQSRRAERYLRRGCVPMQTSKAETHEVRFSYEFYP